MSHRWGRWLGVLVLGLALGCSALPGPLSRNPFAATPVWEQPPPPPNDAPVVDASRLHRAVLPNGLQLLVLEDHRLPAFDAGIVVRRGQAVEGREEAGLTEFTTELMQRGAGDRDGLALARVVDDLGADLHASSSWDEVTVGVSGLVRDRDTLLDVLADVVLRPRFDPKEGLKVRGEQLASIRRARDDPAQLAATHFLAALYPHHRFGLPAAGSEETVRHFDAARARAFHDRIFSPRDAIFYATGDVHAEDVIAGVRARFGAWKGGPPGPPAPEPAPPPARRVIVVDRPELVQAQVLVGHEGIRRTDPARIAVQEVNAVLGSGGFSSRMMTRIRTDEGLTYSIGSSFSMRREIGPFAVSSFTRIPKVGKLVGGILDELKRIRDEPPTPQELSFVQSLLAGSFALALETSEAVTGSLVDLDVYGLPRDSLDTYRSRVRAVTPAAAAEVARARIHPERATIVVVGPAKALRPQLEPFGKVEVVRP